MRKLLYIFTLFAIISLVNTAESYAQSGQELLDICNMVADDAMYLKDFQIKLEAAKPGEEPPKAIHSLVLSKNVRYRFSICNSKDYSGEAVIQIFDNNRLMVTNHMVATGKYYPTVDFKCSSAGVYHIFVNFKEGQQGLALVLLSYVEKL